MTTPQEANGYIPEYEHEPDPNVVEICQLRQENAELRAQLARVEGERDRLSERPTAGAFNAMCDAGVSVYAGARSLRAELDAAQAKLSTLQAACEAAKVFVLAHEAWEAKLIVDGNWGSDGMDPLPKFTWPIYDEFMEVQGKRNETKEILATALESK